MRCHLQVFCCITGVLGHDGGGGGVVVGGGGGGCVFFFFFNDTATTEIYTLSLHDALPILQEWESEFVSWNPSDYGQLENIYVDPDLVWHPNIEVENRYFAHLLHLQ